MDKINLSTKPKIICLTPVKNESWILEKFLMAASLWADHIIVADQHSEDNSREIARRFPKVTLIENPSSEFNEPERQRLLIEAARDIDGPKFLITLDADEFLTANFHNSTEWDFILKAPPGTVVRFKWVNLKPGFQKCWFPSEHFPWGFMDDGSEHFGKKIHSTRIPIPANAMTIDLNQIKVLHFQYVDWDRMSSKHRWYQSWEVINQPSRRAMDIYIQYHHMYDVHESDIHDVQDEWFGYYLNFGIDLRKINKQEKYWWDREVLRYFQQYGTHRFRKLDIWEADWAGLSKYFNFPVFNGDPRSRFDKFVHQWLKTGEYKVNSLRNRCIRRFIKWFCW